MPVLGSLSNPIVDTKKLLDEWLARLAALVADVEAWAREVGWSTRRIDTRIEDSQLGAYRAPSLLMQEGTTRVLLEPIARFAPGTEGVADLYLMPAFDDIASIYFLNGNWHLHYLRPGSLNGAKPRETKPKKLTKATFRKVLDEMKRNAA